MLTDREQRALNEIERDLSATDPRLSAKLARGSGRRTRRRSALEVLAIVTSVVLVATGAFDSRPGMIVAGVVGLALLLGGPFAVRHWKAGPSR
ncbi:DUF3040 domain-containing protein [Amycolatopsis orientalis]|uniref:DUF3040 domain-containing protein n=1 Tax=Amycolatopsis orientalis TaxID=31958 RepID=UPI0003A34B05|nr:DUF3040 domain-containing protein [Amycolatopsis orientalis]